MSLNIWRKDAQELEKVSGQVNINDNVENESTTWSSSKISDSLVDKADKTELENYAPTLRTDITTSAVTYRKITIDRMKGYKCLQLLITARDDTFLMEIKMNEGTDNTLTLKSLGTNTYISECGYVINTDTIDIYFKLREWVVAFEVIALNYHGEAKVNAELSSSMPSGLTSLAVQELATMDKVAKRKTITVQTDSNGNIGLDVPVEKFVNAFIINQGELVRFLNVYTWANVAYGRVTDLSGNVITGTHTVTILYNE